MRIKESKGLRWRNFITAACLCALALAGCGGSASYSEETAEVSGVSENAALQEYNETAAAETSDGQKKILVYEGSVSIDAMEFEEAVRAFKTAVGECGGFLEDEQSNGAGIQYGESSSYHMEESRTFMATARIPSETYQEFMEKAEGIGKVIESTSKVTNMTRQYGTLQAELEIYEAEYERYLKMFDEVSDDNAMIAIQEKLTELSLNIARTKSEMAVIDTDAAYSTVQVRIYEVAAYRENGAGFFQRLGNTLSDSWAGMLAFFEGILFFFILHWYKLLLLFLIIFFIVKFAQKLEARNKQKRQQAMQAYQQRQQQEVRTAEPNQEKAEAAEVNKEEIKESKDNQEKVQAKGVKHE